MFIQNSWPANQGSRSQPFLRRGAARCARRSRACPDSRHIFRPNRQPTVFPSLARTYCHELPPIAAFRTMHRAMLPDRQTIRLQNYDYSHPGMYFITICTYDREPILGTIDAGYVIPTDVGKFVEQTWRTLPDRFPNLKTDKFILMP